MFLPPGPKANAPFHVLPAKWSKACSLRKAPVAMSLKSVLFRFRCPAAVCLRGKGQHSTSAPRGGEGSEHFAPNPLCPGPSSSRNATRRHVLATPSALLCGELHSCTNGIVSLGGGGVAALRAAPKVMTLAGWALSR